MIKDKFVYTPGPTAVKENVRLARAEATTNPDIDLEFLDYYKGVCENIGKVIGTKNSVYILSGEGILGLEAACASLTESGDRVLVLDNGIFGRGFGDFVNIYGGQVVYFKGDYHRPIDIKKLEDFLREDSDFKYATIVHCDTPTGVINDISKICPLLKKYGIITVVDSVSGMVGEEVRVDEWKIDIILGGSQKAISAPTGLTIVGLSEEARKIIKNRRTQVVGFYCNLGIWENYYKEKWFPYTMPISDIYGLDVAINNILEEGITNVIERHEKVAIAVRKAVVEYGLELYLKEGYSNTVTVIKIPEKVGALSLRDYLLEKYNLLIATSLDEYENKVIRIGHMGENCRKEKIVHVLDILDKGLRDLGFKSKESLVNLFDKYYYRVE